MVQFDREIQPAADLLMIPHRTQRRKSICTPIREVSVEESFQMNGPLMKKKSIEFDENDETDKNNNLKNVSKIFNYDEKDEFLDEVEEFVEEDPLTWIDAESFGGVFTHHGSNLFLRLGALSNLNF